MTETAVVNDQLTIASLIALFNSITKKTITTPDMELRNTFIWFSSKYSKCESHIGMAFFMHYTFHIPKHTRKSLFVEYYQIKEVGNYVGPILFSIIKF